MNGPIHQNRFPGWLVAHFQPSGIHSGGNRTPWKLIQTGPKRLKVGSELNSFVMKRNSFISTRNSFAMKRNSFVSTLNSFTKKLNSLLPTLNSFVMKLFSFVSKLF